MASYTEKMMDHFRNPRNAGEPEGANATGEAGSSHCGDVIRIFLRIEGDLVADAGFETFGSGPAIASSSVLTELVKGKPVPIARAIEARDVVEALDGLPPHKLRSAILATKALRRALESHDRNKGFLLPVDLLTPGEIGCDKE